MLIPKLLPLARTALLVPALSIVSGVPVRGVEPAAVPPAVPGIEGAHLLKENGGWCWYQGPRAIVTRGGQLLFTSISGDAHAGHDPGDLWLTSWDLNSGRVAQFELHDKFHCDDHNVAGLLERPDGRVLAVYGKHGNDQLQRWRISERPGDYTSWSKERTFDTGARYTYSNVFQLSGEAGRVYNFSRTRGYNPNCTISDDGGKSWRWEAITTDSKTDSLRPVIPDWDSEKRALLWARGKLKTYADYRLDIVGMIEER